jgi:phosphohistidine phosphatase
MKLYVMRHAQASFNASTDRERQITQLGVDQTNQLIQEHASVLSEINLVWSSDLKRAKQTASIVTELLGLDSFEKTFLSPDGDVQKVLAELQRLHATDCLLIVSHQPLVGELVGYLLNGNMRYAHPYTTSEMIALDLDLYEPGMATLSKQYLPA